MTIQQVIDDVKYSELKQLAVKTDDKAIISFINLGLIELYKRFPLKAVEVIIELNEYDTIYTLPEDCISIIGILGEDGKYYNVNDESYNLTIMTPSYNTIQVPEPREGMAIGVKYSALPVPVVEKTDTLPLNKSFLSALYSYIGYKGHTTVNSNVKGENNTHYMRFESACAQVEKLGIITSEDVVTSKLEDRGFV